MMNSGFEKYPERLENYTKFKASGKKVKVDYMPVKADIENVSRCNFRCAHCLFPSYGRYSRAEDLSLDDFKSFIDDQYGLVEIKIQGIGEPFLQKEFPDMVKYASERYIWVRTTTNGSVLHLNENYKRIIDANVGELQVSFDGATKETFEKIRTGADFNRIVDNCKKLNGYCRETGIDMTRMWSVLQQQNIHEAAGLVEIAAEMGFKRLTMSLELRDWFNTSSVAVDNKGQRLFNMGGEWIENVTEKASDCGVELTFWFAADRFSDENICFWPFERFLLTSDRYIVPCCIIADPSIMNLGRYEDFNKLWFGEVFEEFRKTHLKGDIPMICKSCYGKN
ncbi:MAG: radical SAM/SPASM domain-containing protein [Deferribacterales bacterium]